MMMQERFLDEVLSEYVERSKYTTGQLANLSGIPKSTITNWITGRVSKPRVRNDLLKLATALHLGAAETTRLLQAAHHPSLPELLALPDNQQDKELLSPWIEALQREPYQILVERPNFFDQEKEKRIHDLRRLLRSDCHQTVFSLPLYYLLPLAALLIMNHPQAVRTGWIIYLFECIEAEANKTSLSEVEHMLDAVAQALLNRIERGRW